MQMLFKVHVIDQQWSFEIYLQYPIMLKIIESIWMAMLNFYNVDKHTFAKSFNRFICLVFVQYRCPGIIEMKQTWADICKSMTTLESDIKKNAMTKQNRLSMKAQQSQQQLSNLVSTSDLPSAQPDPIQNE